MYVHVLEPSRIILKQTRTHRLLGHRPKVVIKREKVIYVALI